MSTRIRLKRVYEPPADDDGRRIFVERLWPRGVSRERAAIDQWMKEIAPSQELRRWYAHDPTKWEEFGLRYEEELDGHPDLVAELAAMAREGTLTLVFASRDAEHSSARLLKDYIMRRLSTD